jgi:phosphoribosylglycinamide formyltransferase 1
MAARLAAIAGPDIVGLPRLKEAALATTPLRVVVLVSGTGTNLQALLDACADDGYGAHVVAVGADRSGTLAIERAERVGVPTFVLEVKQFEQRADWDAALTEAVAAYTPGLILLAGFMKLVGPAFMARFDGRIMNTHPALAPSFPGMHGSRDALAYGVKVTGCTLFFVDEGIDTGPIIAQAAVPVLEGDDDNSLHERIKVVERQLLVDTVGALARDGWTVIGRRVTIP